MVGSDNTVYAEESCCAQGRSAGSAVNSHVLPEKVPEKLEIDIEGDVLPAKLAASHATKYCDNIQPVS